jgi:probable DNA metabolism protein
MNAYPRGANPREGAWSYDGSLEGLMLLAHRSYSESSVPDAVANTLALEGELFGPVTGAHPEPNPQMGTDLHLEADFERQAEAAAAALGDFSGELFYFVMKVWMSEEALELPLLRICAEAGLHGAEVLADHGNADLRAVSRAARRVNCEIHKLTGLARFSDRGDGMYSAPLEPDANILCALLPHFARRFGASDFALVDLRRHLAFARRGGVFESVAGPDSLSYLPLSAGESADEEIELWRRYFKAAENPARRNPGLQRRLMPRRYWKYLPELGGNASHANRD